jgi:3-hydroxyacyl-[acyl-carrier-protein] dehydratase
MVDTEGQVKEIEHVLPHRYPFRMIDRVVELDPGQRVVALKAISADDFFCAGHFPGTPCIAEVLIVEAMAQAGGIVFLSTKGEGAGILVRVEEMQFHRTVRPGAELILSAEMEFSFGAMAKVRVKAEAGGETVAQGIVVVAEGQR